MNKKYPIIILTIAICALFAASSIFALTQSCVVPPSTTTTTLLSSSQITIGQSVTDTAIVTGLNNQVTYKSAGAGASTTENTLNVPYPSASQGYLMLLQIVVKDTTNTPTTPDGWTLLYGPDTSGTARQWIYYKFATSDMSSGSILMSIEGSAVKAARIYTFQNVSPTSFTEGASYRSNPDSNTISAQAVTTTGTNRLAVSFAFDTENKALSAFTGETGGDWTEPTGEYKTNIASSKATLQLQKATLTSAGTISGGQTSISTAASWGVRAFALIPTQIYPTGTINFQVLVPSGTWTTFDTKPLTQGQATSTTYTPTTIGTYYFRAIYSGSTTYQASQSGLTEEPLSVVLQTSTVTTILSQETISLGTSITDTAIVTDGATGTITFEVSIDGQNFLQYGATKTLSGSSPNTVESDPYTPLTIGTYYFRAVYSGDANYEAAQSANDAEVLNVFVVPESGFGTAMAILAPLLAVFCVVIRKKQK